MLEIMSVTEAAQRLGVNRARVHQLIKAGLLEAEKIGNTFVVSNASVEKRLASMPRGGRPRKTDSVG